MGAAGRVALGNERREVADRFHRDAARALFETLGRMKGLPMKAGQMLSYLDDYLPAEVRAAYREGLEALQTRAAPVRWSALRAVIEEDLGASVEELFAEIDPEPLAAASIGQVYRARLPDGRPVAVKVQYPGIAEAVRSDLENVQLLRNALALVLPSFEVERTLADIRDRVLEECDYGCERCNQEEFLAAWRGDPEVLVPELVPELCSERVLVSELVTGRTLQRVAAEASAEDRNRYGQILYRFVFRSLYLHGMFNADPHPGNYLFPADGRVAFLDFGCVQRFSPAAVRRFLRVRQHVVAGDCESPAFRELAREVWGLPELDEEEWGYLADYLRAVYAPVLSAPFRFDRAYTERLADLSLRGAFLGARKALRKGVREARTPGLVFLTRITYGFTSVLAQLEAEGDFAAITRAIDEEALARLPDGEGRTPS